MHNLENTARSVARAHRSALLMLLVSVSACAGKSPLGPDTGDSDCPDLTGSYCSIGLEWEGDRGKSERAYLPTYLGIRSTDNWQSISRVDIDGPNEVMLKVTLHTEDQMVTSAEILRSDLICQGDRLAFEMNKVPWGGAGPFLALGASAGWRVIERGDAGNLIINETRRETGTIMLVIPLRIRTDTRAEFPPAGDNECEAW